RMGGAPGAAQRAGGASGASGGAARCHGAPDPGDAVLGLPAVPAVPSAVSLSFGLPGPNGRPGPAALRRAGAGEPAGAGAFSAGCGEGLGWLGRAEHHHSGVAGPAEGAPG
ncbi:unnamed protein product, partial [Effrenium voratum]